MEKSLKNDLLHNMMVWIILSVVFIAAFAAIFYLSSQILQLRERHQSVQSMLDQQIRLTDAYSWEVESKRYELMETLGQLKKTHENSIALNKKLEGEVSKRTEALLDQNQKIIDYHFINAHKLRAPVARILGLTSLLANSAEQEDNSLIIQHLNKATTELDETVHTIQQTLCSAEYKEQLKSA